MKIGIFGPGARDTWRHEDATRGSKWDHSKVAIWHAMHALIVTSGSQSQGLTLLFME